MQEVVSSDRARDLATTTTTTAETITTIQPFIVYMRTTTGNYSFSFSTPSTVSFKLFRKKPAGIIHETRSKCSVL